MHLRKIFPDPWCILLAVAIRSEISLLPLNLGIPKELLPVRIEVVVHLKDKVLDRNRCADGIFDDEWLYRHFIRAQMASPVADRRARSLNAGYWRQREWLRGARTREQGRSLFIVALACLVCNFDVLEINEEFPT